MAQTIRLLTITLKQLYLAPPNFGDSSFLSIRHILAEFSKIDSPAAGVAAVVLEMRSRKIEDKIFFFRLKTMKMQRRV